MSCRNLPALDVRRLYGALRTSNWIFMFSLRRSMLKYSRRTHPTRRITKMQKLTLHSTTKRVLASAALLSAVCLAMSAVCLANSASSAMAANIIQNAKCGGASANIITLPKREAANGFGTSGRASELVNGGFRSSRCRHHGRQQRQRSFLQGCLDHDGYTSESQRPRSRQGQAQI